MREEFAQQTADVRARVSSLVRARKATLVSDISAALPVLTDALGVLGSRECAEVLIQLFDSALATDDLDPQTPPMRDLARYCAPLATRHLAEALHQAERIILDEIALDDQMGATSQPWAMVAYSIRRATLEIMAGYAEHLASREVPIILRDTLTTLIAAPAFELALAHEIERALRHKKPLSLLMFDLDDLAEFNRRHGYGVGDRVLERLGILSRRFFRTHDWVARIGDDSIAVLLPEATLDQAAVLGERFRDTVHQRLALHDYKTDSIMEVDVSVAAVGADVVQSGMDSGYVLSEAEAAVIRAKRDGRHHIERVALQPTSVTIFGAASLLGCGPRDVIALMRQKKLPYTRRGRHFHIDRAAIENVRSR